MSDRWVYALLAGAVAGALLARPIPILVVVCATVTASATWRRAPVACCLAAALLTSFLAARAWSGLDLPAREARAVDGVAVLRSDPAPSFGGVRVVLSLGDGRRAVADVRGAPAGVLRPMLAGERVEVAGRLRPLEGRARDLLAARHIGARLDVVSLRRLDEGGPAVRFANSLRRTLDRGARGLPEGRRELFLGFVLGDDRNHRPAVVDDFRASGLSHLLAVSGQNVAFVLLLAAPVLSRMRLWPRLAVTLGILATFALVTRAEPSVLRACVVAGVAAAAFTSGRPQSSLRLLAVAAVLLLVADPLLVHSLGFRMSVAASAGILVLCDPIRRWVRGPGAVRDAFAVTISAQAGVLPVLLPTFGGVPVVSLLANALAVPAAGAVMVWGIVAGLPAGLLPDPFAAWLHVPTSLLVGWVGGVARVSAGLPLGQVTFAHAVVAAGAALVCLSARAHPRVVRAGAAVAVVALAVAPAAGVQRQARKPLDGVAITKGARVWRGDGATVVLVGNAQTGRLLEALRRKGVRRPDVLVLHDAGDEEDLLARLRPRALLRAGETTAGSRIRIAGLEVETDPP